MGIYIYNLQFNLTFDVFSQNKIKSLTQLQDPELLLKLLIEM